MTGNVLVEVGAERKRQDSIFGTQNHRDGTSDHPVSRRISDGYRDICRRITQEGDVTWKDILSEEVYEAYAEADPVLLRAELVQVAAGAVAWIEAIDRRPPVSAEEAC